MDYHFIYLIQEKQDIVTNSSIFKIGKSTQENTRRVKSYPSGSHLLLQVACNNCHRIETYLIQQFRNIFTLERGREYFKGDVFKMINLIFCVVQNEFNPSNVEYMVTDDNNLSLYVHSKDKFVNYSFNNKENILNNYHLELSSVKNEYKHLDQQHKTYKSNSIDKMKFIEISDKVEELKLLNNSIQIINNELFDSNNKYKQDFLHKDKQIATLENVFSIYEIYEKNVNGKLSLEDKLNRLHLSLSNKDDLINELNSKNNLITKENQILDQEIKQQKLVIKSINYRLSLFNDEKLQMKKSNTKIIHELESNQKKHIIDTELFKIKSFRSYFILYGYLMYILLYHLYEQPNLFINWLLLGGSVILHYNIY